MFGFKLSHLVTALIVALVGYTSSVAIIFQAIEMLGATKAETNSWMLSLGVGMGICCIWLSYQYKKPILCAWSTPGAALMVVALDGVNMGEAIGAFLFCALLLIITGVSGLFEKITKLVPQSVANAMLAGIIFQFGMNVFLQMDQQLMLVGVMITTYIIGKVFFGRYNVPIVFLAGILVCFYQGLFMPQEFTFEIAKPVFMTPIFDWNILISLGLPLYVVTMTSQNMPGVATLRAAGFEPPISQSVTITGLVSLVLAPFGGYAFNLGAITAALAMSPDADPDPKTRYKAGIMTGIIYCIIGLLGAAVVSLFLIMPKALVVAIAGIALFGTLSSSMLGALEDVKSREAATIAFLMTVSGIEFFDISSAFWGLLLGVFAQAFMDYANQRKLA